MSNFLGEMAANERGEGNESASSLEDDEMKIFKKSALQAVTFKIVRDESQLQAPLTKGNSFKPEMAHQVFGESEMIFGYRFLKITLYYLHNSARCCAEVLADGKLEKSEMCEPDDVLAQLTPWLPEGFVTDKERFREEVRKEKHDTMFGEVVGEFANDGKTYKVALCDSKDPEFREFHQRFQTFIVWFIDGANFIDLEDSRWMIFYVYEESTDEATNETYRSPVAFCTIYKFFCYPASLRTRISQFLVLPTHQRRGVATKFYPIVYQHLKSMPEVVDITVEEPTETFQKIRDFCDSLCIHEALQKDKINVNTAHPKQINECMRKHKLCKRQSQRVLDVLRYFSSHIGGKLESKKFINSVKNRIRNEIDKETKGSKRLCNLQRAGIAMEPLDKEAIVDSDFNRYVDGLAWPADRLKGYLAKFSVN